MIVVVGIFAQREAAAHAIRDLRILGIAESNLDLLLPALSEEQFSGVQTADSEQPGMGRAMGTVVGGAIGVAAGMSLGTAAASFFVPGIGPVLAAGSLGAALLGLAGAVSGGAAGKGMDRALLEGLPRDELFIYMDALRQGRSIVICLARDELERDECLRILEREGVESIDAARQQRWASLADAEGQHYDASAAEIVRDDDPFRHGFAAALHPEFYGKPWDQVVYLLAERYRDWSEKSFREGFERGQRIAGTPK